MVDSFSRRQSRRKGRRPASQSAARPPGKGGLFSARNALAALAVFTFPAVADGAGSVSFGNGRLIDGNASSAFAVAAADLDGDGDVDVLASLVDDDEVYWYENVDGTGTFAERSEISGCCERTRPTSIAVGDLNGDGFPDIVVTFATANLVTWFRNSDGLGDFATGADIAADVNSPQRTIVADIDDDGDLDVLSTSWADDRVTWYENTDGAGTFAVGLEISTTIDAGISMVAVDLDGDDDLDVLVASYYDDRVTWFNNTNGNGAFALGIDIALDAGGPAYVAAADLDGDLDVDVISAFYDNGRIIWYENTDGAGTFAAGVDIDILDSAESVVAVDLDNDGDIDLVVAESLGGRIVWYENTDGMATFSTANDIAEDVGVEEVIVADIDGDGDFDLVAASRDQGRVVWYENLLIDTATTTSNDNDVDDDDLAETPSPAQAVEPLVDTFAPDAVIPYVDSDGDDSSDSRWLDAAWEIAITVTGGVLVALVVAFVLRRHSHDVQEDLVGVSIPRQRRSSCPVDEGGET
ncbi:unnamed protein product [Scytosiphon promiscuus]